MSLFSIADLHLSLSTDKPMDKFGSRWKSHAEKIEKNWRAIVSPADTVVIPGDISWGMSLEESRADLAFIHSLPGKKLIGKGNHDFWWSTAKKMTEVLEENHIQTIKTIYNNAHLLEDCIVCGTRGWFYDKNDPAAGDDKIFKRELLRLEASLQSAGELPKTVFLHYPPKYKGYECPQILQLLEKYDVRSCYYGHLHGASHGLAVEGLWNGVEFRLVSVDRLNFQPYRVLL